MEDIKQPEISRNTLVGEDYDFVKAKDPEQASLYYKRYISDFKTNNPHADANTMDKAAERLGQILAGNVDTNPTGGHVGSKGRKADEAKFTSFVNNDRASSFERNKDDFSRFTALNNLQAAENDIENVGKLAESAPEEADKAFDSWSNNYKAAAKKAGMPVDMMEQAIAKQQSDVTHAKAATMIDDDPENAEKELAGTSQGQIASATKKVISQIAEDAQKEEADELHALSLSSFNKKDLEASKSPKDKKVLRDIQKDPFKASERLRIVAYGPLNVNDPSSLEERVSQTEIASDVLGTEVPILDKGEISRMKESLKSVDKGIKVAELFWTAPHDVKSQASDQMGDSAQAFTLRLNDLERGLAKDILQGVNAPSKKVLAFEKNVEAAYIYDPLLNKQSLKAMNALVATGKYNKKEARDKVLNLQEVDEGFLGFGGYKLPIPRGKTAEEFEDVAERLLKDSSRITEFANGEVAKMRTSTGKIVDLSEDSLKWFPVGDGTYGLEDNDGNVLKNANGDLLEIDMERALGEI